MQQGRIGTVLLHAVGVAFFAVAATILHTYDQFPQWIGWFNAMAGLASIMAGGIWALGAHRKQS